MREIDDRFRIIAFMKDGLKDVRSPHHTRHFLVHMVRQRVTRLPPAMNIATTQIFCGYAIQDRLPSRKQNRIIGLGKTRTLTTPSGLTISDTD